MIQRCPLDSRGLLCVSGKDAQSFLQGYATCDLTALDAAQALPGALCNIKGRMLTSFLIAQHEDRLLLRMHRPLVPRTMDFLAKYIVFSKAELQDVSDEWHLYGEFGGGAGLEGSAGAASKAGREAATNEQTAKPSFALAQTETQLTISLGFGQEVWSRQPLAAEADEQDWQSREVAQGLAWVEEATSEQFLPQMLNYHQLDAVDFQKGCYLGQEVVARAQYRGQIKRRLHTVAVAGAQPGDSCDGGIVVAAGKHQALAVLNNAEAQQVSINLNGQQVAARLLP